MEQAYGAIKDRIMTLDLAPGHRLDDIALSEELGLSRTPVREALFRLGSEGLITLSARGGFSVRALDLQDVSQLFEAHIVVARAIARLAAIRASDADIGRLKSAADLVDQAIDRRAAADIAASNAALHRLEAEVARNEHLNGLAGSIHDQGQRLAYLCFGGQPHWTDQLSDHFARVAQDHHDLIAAVSARDADAAERVAARHVHLFRARVQRFIFSDLGDGVRLAEDLRAGTTPGAP